TARWNCLQASRGQNSLTCWRNMDSGTKTWRNKLHKFRTQKRKLNGILCRTGGCCFLLFQRIFKHQMAVFETRQNLNELIKFLLILPLQGAIYFHGKNSVRKVCSRIPKITKAEDVPHFHKWGTASAFLMTQYPSLTTQCFDCTNSDTPSYCNSET
ncbi:hypothetical protein SAMN05216583_1441, partial [Selenomonas sp. KH1T6]